MSDQKNEHGAMSGGDLANLEVIDEAHRAACLEKYGPACPCAEYAAITGCMHPDCPQHGYPPTLREPSTPLPSASECIAALEAHRERYTPGGLLYDVVSECINRLRVLAKDAPESPWSPLTERS